MLCIIQLNQILMSILGFNNSYSDWIDPAIVSFRQFPQFNPQQQQQAQNQANNDLFMSQMNQQGNSPFHNT